MVKVNVGDRFGRLVVTGQPYIKSNGKGKAPFCLCVCDCGKEKHIRIDNVVAGRTLSCGCLFREQAGSNFYVHGLTETRLYRIWQHMKNRCLKPVHPYYHRYGGRGITVCDEWIDDFKAFHDWALTSGYQPHLQIDRTDNEGNYTPTNCRWTTSKTNNRNRCDNVRFEAFGETKLKCEWADDPRCVVSKQTFIARIDKKWSVERALITPLFNRGQKKRH